MPNCNHDVIRLCADAGCLGSFAPGHTVLKTERSFKITGLSSFSACLPSTASRGNANTCTPWPDSNSWDNPVVRFNLSEICSFPLSFFWCLEPCRALKFRNSAAPVIVRICPGSLVPVGDARDFTHEVAQASADIQHVTTWATRKCTDMAVHMRTESSEAR